jgi:hypothetical protein
MPCLTMYNSLRHGERPNGLDLARQAMVYPLQHGRPASVSVLLTCLPDEPPGNHSDFLLDNFAYKKHKGDAPSQSIRHCALYDTPTPRLFLGSMII